MKVKMWVWGLLASFSLSAVPLDPDMPAQWMSGRYGVMAFWLYAHCHVTDRMPYVDEPVEAFDLEGFMKDFDETGADWLFFTLGQSTGAYASPNKALAEMCGAYRVPSRRDLVKEIGRELKKRGKRLICYLPCDMLEPSMRQIFRWSHDDKENAYFQTNWTRIVSVWSRNFGRDCDGWFFDGATLERYVPGKLHTELWRAAAQAGNPDAVMGFNSGIVTIRRDGSTNNLECVYDGDYLSGEANAIREGGIVLRQRVPTPGQRPPVWIPTGPYERSGKRLCHTHFPLEGYWNAYGAWSRWHATQEMAESRPELLDPQKMREMRLRGEFPDPLYTPEELEKVVRNFTSVGAAVTVNVGVNEKGRMNPKSVRLFQNFRSINARQKKDGR